MRVRNSSKSYGSVAMALHWAVVLLVLGAALTGLFGDELPRGAAREAGHFAHVSFGLAILGFVLARLYWRLSDPPPLPIRSQFGEWGDRAAQLAHYAIYALLIAIPVVGIAAQFAHGEPLPLFGLFEIASPWTADRAFAHDLKEVHEALATGLMALVGLHALAALVHHYVLHDRTLVRMLPALRAGAAR
jgi:cytochrome b561